MSNKQIEFEMEQYTIQKFFEADRKYYIPDYQRSYSWGEKQLQNWKQDIEDAIHTNAPYYLGRILLEQGEQLAIIDGQQRLLTTLLFLHAAVHTQNRSDVLPKNEIASYCKKIKLGEVDNDFFQSLLVRNEDWDETTCETKAQKRILEAHSFFKKYFTDNDEIKAICSMLLNASIVCIQIDNKRTGTLMFELENDRGVSLTQLEKLKAYLMYQVQLHEEKDIEARLGELSESFNEIGRIANRISDNPDTILAAHFHTFISREVPKVSNPYTEYSLDKIKSYFEKYLKDEENDIVVKIIELAKGLQVSFEAVEYIKDVNFYGELNYIKYIEVPNYAWPFLLCNYHKNNKNNKIDKKLTKLMTKLILRQEIAGIMEHAGNVTITKRDYLGSILKDYCDDESKNIDNLVEVFNDAFEEEWKKFRGRKKLWSKEVFLATFEGLKGDYPHRLVKFFLYLYEVEYYKRNPPKDLTLEHISPQEAKEGSESNKIDDSYVDYIGNLCLLERSINSSANNNDFAYKLSKYKKSKVKHTKCIYEEQPKLTKDFLDKRGKQLIKFIVKHIKENFA